VHNRFKTGSTQCIHTCAECTNAWQNNRISGCGNTGVSSKYSIGTDTF
jgi:hypothetical protein